MFDKTKQWRRKRPDEIKSVMVTKLYDEDDKVRPGFSVRYKLQNGEIKIEPAPHTSDILLPGQTLL